MPKRLVEVGNCSVDHWALQRLIQTHFPCVEIVQAEGADHALAALLAAPCDLVLINRKLDYDYSDGIEVIKQLKSEPAVRSVPMMLLTNYPEYQSMAIAAGAEHGFGKLEYDQPVTIDKLRPFLSE